MKTQMSLAINNNLLSKISEVADKLNIGRDALIIKAVKKYLFISEVKEIRKKLKPIVKKKGFNTEDDIFNAVS